MQLPIALAVLNGANKVGFHCIEDAYITGLHYQVEDPPGSGYIDWNCKVWREDLGYAQWETVRFNIVGTAIDNDDIVVSTP